MKRKLEEAEFEIEKARKEGEFNLGLAKAEFQSQLNVINEQLARAEQNNTLLREELSKMKNFYEQKISEKNSLIEKVQGDMNSLKISREEKY